MNLIFLRGKEPTDRDFHETLFTKLELCDDMWTHFAYNLLRKGDNGEVVYWGANRTQKYKSNFREVRVNKLEDYKPKFEPDVIFARGGFPEYHTILKRYPNAFKIYYGAGKRFMPNKYFTNYNLVLVDSWEQQLEVQKIYPSLNCSSFIKPAADNIMYPMECVKEYDVCFPANGSQENIKGHKFVYTTAPCDLSILNLGNRGTIAPPVHVVSQRVPRPSIRRYYAKCKVGIVCVNKDVDSCPRVIPEMLACGLPIVVLKGTQFWQNRYMSSSTGIVASKDKFWDAVRFVRNNYHTFNSRKHYEDHLSMKCATNHIRTLIKYWNIT